MWILKTKFGEVISFRKWFSLKAQSDKFWMFESSFFHSLVVHKIKGFLESVSPVLKCCDISVFLDW